MEVKNSESPFIGTRELIERAGARDVAALAFGIWQLLANLQGRAQHGPRLSGVGTRIDLAALSWSQIHEAIDDACVADPRKALVIAEQFELSPLQHFRDWAERLRAVADNDAA